MTAEREYDLADLVRAWLSRPRLTIGVPLAIAVLTAVVTLLLPVTYTATTTFVAETGSQPRLPSSLAGLASQFGIALGSEAGKSPKFYAEVVRSRELMERVLADTYPGPEPGATATLLDLLTVTGPDSARRMARGVRKLRSLVGVSVSPGTNIVSLHVDARSPIVAAAVANRFVAHLNAFNTQHRTSQAREQRTFVEQRLTGAEGELRTAEEELRVFYERNRSWRDAPHLTFEEGRLRRQLDVRQEIYLTLKREYETARIQEVNDTPVITVIDRATPPVRKSKPRRSLIVVLAAVLAGMFTATWVAGLDYFGSLRARPHP